MHLFRHAGPDPASRRRPDESREPSQRLGPGFHREPWIPAPVSKYGTSFAGMTTFWETVSLWTDTNYWNLVIGYYLDIGIWILELLRVWMNILRRHSLLSRLSLRHERSVK